MTYITLLNVDYFMYILLIISTALWYLKSLYGIFESLYYLLPFINIFCSAIIFIGNNIIIILLYPHITPDGTIPHTILTIIRLLLINICNYKSFKYII